MYVKDNETDPVGSDIITLPAISLWRTGITPATTEIGNRSNFRRGASLRDPKSESTSAKFNRTLPIHINYQLDIWTQKRSHNDSLFTDIMFILNDSPYIEFSVPNFENKLKFELRIEDVTDNTDISSFTSVGRLYRTTIDLVIESAQLFYQGDRKLVLDIPITQEAH